jgi:hypothetical protein
VNNGVQVGNGVGNSNFVEVALGGGFEVGGLGGVLEGFLGGRKVGVSVDPIGGMVVQVDVRVALRVALSGGGGVCEGSISARVGVAGAMDGGISLGLRLEVAVALPIRSGYPIITPTVIATSINIPRIATRAIKGQVRLGCAAVFRVGVPAGTGGRCG